MTIQAYPLAWPAGWKRTAPQRRTRARFSKGVRQYPSDPNAATWLRQNELSVSDATVRVLQELERLGVERQDTVISTNVRVRLDGLPRSGERAPDDPGVAVYWTDRAASAPRCMAIDRYDRVADNLAAVAATIEAIRAIERHGGAEILNRAFTGFTALPAPGAARSWREIMSFHPEERPPMDKLEMRYRVLRSSAHPDNGGSPEHFSEVQRAYEQARQELLLGRTPR